MHLFVFIESFYKEAKENYSHPRADLVSPAPAEPPSPTKLFFSRPLSPAWRGVRPAASSTQRTAPWKRRRRSPLVCIYHWLATITMLGPKIQSTLRPVFLLEPPSPPLVPQPSPLRLLTAPANNAFLQPPPSASLHCAMVGAGGHLGGGRDSKVQQGEKKTSRRDREEDWMVLEGGLGEE